MTIHVSCFWNVWSLHQKSDLVYSHCRVKAVSVSCSLTSSFFLPPCSVPHRNMNIGGIIFPLEQQSRDEESVVYHGQYDTEGVPHTKSGDRQPVQVSIEVSQEDIRHFCIGFSFHEITWGQISEESWLSISSRRFGISTKLGSPCLL